MLKKYCLFMNFISENRIQNKEKCNGKKQYGTDRSGERCP